MHESARATNINVCAGSDTVNSILLPHYRPVGQAARLQYTRVLAYLRAFRMHIPAFCMRTMMLIPMSIPAHAHRPTDKRGATCARRGAPNSRRSGQLLSKRRLNILHCYIGALICCCCCSRARVNKHMLTHTHARARTHARTHARMHIYTCVHMHA